MKKRNAMTLTEILIATVIMLIAAFPVMAIFSTSHQSLERTDVRRTARHYTSEILARVKRQSLHDLWKNFGPWDAAGLDAEAGRLRDRIAEMDPNGKLVAGAQDLVNPLGFTQDMLTEMRRDGYDARVRFEFYTREELGVSPAQFSQKKKDKVDPVIGLHHMQAGWAEVQIIEAGKPKEVISQVREPIMCPAIVGRPGMKLSSCPAVNPNVRKKYGPLLARREASL